MSTLIEANSEPVRGLAFFGASSSSTSVTYGPKRPFLATTVRWVSGSVPQLALLAHRLGEQLARQLEGELVGGRSSATLARPPCASST